MLDDLKSPFLADAQCLNLPEPCVDENGDNEGKGLWAESFCGDEKSLKDDFDDDNERKFDVHEIEESDSYCQNINKTAQVEKVRLVQQSLLNSKVPNSEGSTSSKQQDNSCNSVADTYEDEARYVGLICSEIVLRVTKDRFPKSNLCSLEQNSPFKHIGLWFRFLIAGK